MKYITLSFDDGRLDTYMTALPILEKNGIKCVINIATDFILHPENYSDKIIPNEAMSVEMVQDAYRRGHEIASHGNCHENSVDDITESIKLLRQWGIDTDDIGFASPYSFIDEKSINTIDALTGDRTISYVRSGTQARRESLFYRIAYVLLLHIGSKPLFYLLNRSKVYGKSNIPDKIIKGITVTNKTTVGQMVHFIEKMPDERCCVFILHSVADSQEQIKNNRWCWASENLSAFCEYMVNSPNIKSVLQSYITQNGD
ncbi:MAG: polysaccharide deacetylase family protein [Clostridia bacterium]|nr:polysaccharide deacetylase family protein [Clostridia bacterium]